MFLADLKPKWRKMTDIAKYFEAVMKYISLKGNSATKIYDDMSVKVRDKHPFYPTVRN
jgi:hypothetical protein